MRGAQRYQVRLTYLFTQTNVTLICSPSAVARYLRCHSNADALNVASVRLKDSALNVMLKYVDDTGKKLELDEGSKDRARAVLKARATNVEGALKFWVINRFGQWVSVSTLVEALYSYADAEEILPSVLAAHSATSNTELMLTFSGEPD